MPDINIGNMVVIISENLTTFPCIIQEDEGNFTCMGSDDNSNLNSTISYNLGNFIFINDS